MEQFLCKCTLNLGVLHVDCRRKKTAFFVVSSKYQRNQRAITRLKPSIIKVTFTDTVMKCTAYTERCEYIKLYDWNRRSECIIVSFMVVLCFVYLLININADVTTISYTPDEGKSFLPKPWTIIITFLNAILCRVSSIWVKQVELKR